MCPTDAERRITPRTRMLMPVHYAGIACDMDAYVKLAEKHGLMLFEDAAQGMGALHRDRHLGTIGDGGFISFHATKNVVCGEGGAFLTNSDSLFERAAIVQEKGTNRSAFLRGEVDRYTWVDVGANLAMPDLSAALLEVQLERMQEMQARRSAVWNIYHAGLADLEEKGLLDRPSLPRWAKHNAHLYFIQARRPGLQQALLSGLRARGIEVSFHFQPLHASPFVRQKLGLEQSLSTSERAAANLVRLPVTSMMSEADAEHVVAEVHAVARAHARAASRRPVDASRGPSMSGGPA
jgi:dTDP-4-amino-4,6-dideoxygalactose transaminase